MDDIEENLDKPWSFNQICSNPNLTEKFVEEHLQSFYISSALFANSNLSIEFCIDLFKKYKEKWNYLDCVNQLSMNKNLRINHIKDNDFPWDWSRISYNKSIEPEDLIINPMVSKYNICFNPKLTLDFINKHKSFGFEEEALISGCNKDISVSDLLSYSQKMKKYMHRRSHATLFDIKNNPDVTWDHVHYHYDLSPEEIMEDLKLDKNCLIKYLIKDIPIEKFQKYIPDLLECNIYKKQLSCNPNITVDDLINYPMVGWDMSSLCSNINP